MSVKKAQEKTGSTRKRSTLIGDRKSGWYVACLAAAESITSLAEEMKVGGMAEGTCQTVVAEGVGAVVSRVPLSEYGQDQLPANLGRLDWVAEKAARHESIAQSFAQRATVIPLRFGTIFLSEQAVKQFIGENHDWIKETLARLKDKIEWGVEIYYDREVLMESLTTRSTAVRNLTDRIAAAPPGQAYLLNKSLQALKQQVARDEIRQALQAIASEMPFQSRELGLPKFSATERGELAGRFAFLVDKDQFDLFRSTAEKLAADSSGMGLRMEIAGPLPPYSFVGQLGVDQPGR